MSKTVRLENYTGHTLTDLETGAQYPTKNKVARVNYKMTPENYTEEGSAIYSYSWKPDAVSGLPEPEDGLVCVVSTPTMNAIKYLCDNDGIIYPKCCVTNNPKRNNKGDIFGCIGFKYNG